jgi:hypothetical protein
MGVSTRSEAVQALMVNQDGDGRPCALPPAWLASAVLRRLRPCAADLTDVGICSCLLNTNTHGHRPALVSLRRLGLGCVGEDVLPVKMGVADVGVAQR